VVKSSNGLIFYFLFLNPAIDPKRRRRLFEASGVKILPKIQNKSAPLSPKKPVLIR
jgi:hypothetical protein